MKCYIGEKIKWGTGYGFIWEGIILGFHKKFDKSRECEYDCYVVAGVKIFEHSEFPSSKVFWEVDEFAIMDLLQY